MDYDASKAGVISLTHNFAREFSPYINVNCVCPGWVKTDMNKDLSLEQVHKEEKDILFNITGASVARCCMVPNNVLPARVNQHVMIIRSGKDFMSYYLLCTLCSNEAKRSLLGMSQSGSTREAITKGEIESFKIVIPSTELLKVYENQVEIIFAHIDIHKQENSKLTELQSLLLAKMGQ